MSGFQEPNACLNRSLKTECTRASPRQQQQNQCQLMQPLQQNQLQLSEEVAPAFEILEKLNKVFERRLAEINEQANGDAALKEITYKEWVALLNQTNTTLIKNIQEIDCETTKRLELMQRKSSTNCRKDQSNEIRKYREDIDSLVHLIRNAREKGDWSTDGIGFETLTEEDIFGEPLYSEGKVVNDPEASLYGGNIRKDQEEESMSYSRNTTMEVGSTSKELGAMSSPRTRNESGNIKKVPEASLRLKKESGNTSKLPMSTPRSSRREFVTSRKEIGSAMSYPRNIKKEPGDMSCSRNVKKEIACLKQEPETMSCPRSCKRESGGMSCSKNVKKESACLKQEQETMSCPRNIKKKPEGMYCPRNLNKEFISFKQEAETMSCPRKPKKEPQEMCCARNIRRESEGMYCAGNTGSEQDASCCGRNNESESDEFGSDGNMECKSEYSCCVANFAAEEGGMLYEGRCRGDPDEECYSANEKKEPEENDPEANIKKQPATDNKSCNVNIKHVQKSKLLEHLKALAIEIAERHDEMRELKRQISSLEDDILYAQKKLQLKDDFIKGLRNDLKIFPKSPCSGTCVRRVSDQLSPNDCCPKMSDTNYSGSTEMDFDVTPRVCSNKNRGSMNSLNVPDLNFNLYQEDEDEDNLVKNLKDELAQFFEIQDSYDQNFGNQKRELQDLQPRINKMVDELVKTNQIQQSKLKFYRRELLNLESTQSSRTLTDEDSGISSDVDPDSQILNGVRSRILNLLNDNQNLMREGHKLRIDNEDFISQAKAKSELLDKTSKALREIADAISIALCKPIHYEQLFDENSTCQRNPIIEALNELLDTLAERDKIIQDLRIKLANTSKTNAELQANSESLQLQMHELKKSMGMNNGQYEGSAQYEHTSRCKLLQNQKFTRLLYEKAEQSCSGESSVEDTRHQNHSEYLRIIDDLTTDLNTLSCQVNMVQSEFLNDDLPLRFENSLKDLETQNDLLQAAVDNVTEAKTTLERTLRTENEDLKNMVHDLRQTIGHQQSHIDELRKKPCERCSQHEKQRQFDQKQSYHRTISDEKLDELESELKWKGQIVEKLKMENECLKRELDIQGHRVKSKSLQSKASTPDRSQSNLQEILSKLNATQEKNIEQCKSLQKASRQIQLLQAEIEGLRANEDSYKKERNLLHSELVALKENEASHLGINKSLREQLNRTTNELMYTKEKLWDCSQQNNRLEAMHKEQKKRFNETHAELIRKHNNLVEDYNAKVEENQKLVQINEEKDKLLSTVELWKKEQIKKDIEMQEKTRIFEQNISSMLEENEKLLQRLSETENQILELQQTLENSRLTLSGNQSGGSVSTRGYKGSYGANSVTYDPICQVIDNVRNTSRKISYQRSIIEDGTRSCAQ